MINAITHHFVGQMGTHKLSTLTAQCFEAVGKGRQIVPTHGGKQEINTINESGLYSAIANHVDEEGVTKRASVEMTGGLQRVPVTPERDALKPIAV